MRIYLSFLIAFCFLSLWSACKDETYAPMDPPECPRRFPDLADWSYQPVSFSWLHPDNVSGLYFNGNGSGIASSGNEIWKTDNDGKTWKKVYHGPVTYLDDIIFSDPIHGFVIGEYNSRACLLTTKDAGSHWDSLYYPTARYLEKISFADSLRGLAIFSDHNYQSYLSKTKDGGNSWEKISGIAHLSSYADMEILKTGFGYVPTDDGKIYFTYDYGDSWTNIESNFHYIHAIQFLDPLVGFISQSSFTFKTEDGGMTWDTISHYSSELIHFYTKDNGIALQIVDFYFDYDVEAGCEALATTHDGGRSWKIGESTSSGIMRKPSYIDSTIIYGITYNPDFNLVKIYR